MSDLLTTEYLINLHGISKIRATSLLKFALSKTIRHIECYGDGGRLYRDWLESEEFVVPKMNKLPKPLGSLKYLQDLYWRGSKVLDLETKDEVLQAFNSYIRSPYEALQVRVESIRIEEQKKNNILTEELEVLRIKASYVDDLKEIIKAYQTK